MAALIAIANNRFADRRRKNGRWMKWWAIVFDVHHTITANRNALIA